jgi:hypothetical protein
MHDKFFIYSCGFVPSLIAHLSKSKNNKQRTSNIKTISISSSKSITMIPQIILTTFFLLLSTLSASTYAQAGPDGPRVTITPASHVSLTLSSLNSQVLTSPANTNSHRHPQRFRKCGESWAKLQSWCGWSCGRGWCGGVIDDMKRIETTSSTQAVEQTLEICFEKSP